MKPPIKNIFALEPSQEKKQLCDKENQNRFESGREKGTDIFVFI